MTSTRITRRALSIVAITLLAAGTAAAAAGGALPMFEGASDEVVVDSTEGTVVEDGSGTTEGDDGVTDSTVDPENHNGSVDHFGKCMAWTHGSAKDATNPSRVELQVAADAAGLSIDDYCATVLAAGAGDDATSDDESADDESSDSADTESEDKSDDEQGDGSGQDNGGNSGHDNGNSGHGNGNSGHGDDGSED